MTEDQSDTREGFAKLAGVVPEALRGSYRAKLFISIVVVVLLLGAVGGVNYIQAEQTVEEDASQQMTSTVEMQADAVNEWMTSMEAHTRSVSSATPLVAAEPGAAEEHLTQEQATLPVDIRAIHLIDGDDQEVVASTDPDLDSVDLSDSDNPWTDIEPGVDLTSPDDVWHSQQAYRSDQMDDQIMSFASPVVGDETNIVVLVGTIEYRVDNLHQPHDGQETVILDAAGDTVFASGSTDIETAQDEIEPLATDRAAVGFDDQDDPVAYASVENYDWVAATVAPDDEVYAASDAVGTSVLAIIAVALIALFGLGAVISRQTVRPLKDLGQRAKQMENGDLDVELQTARVDEIGGLYGRFDAMRESLQTTIAEAENARQSAEQAQREVETEREQLEQLTDELVETAESFSRTMQEAADGDLTVRMDPQTDNEAMEMVAKQFNAMLREFSETINHLNDFSDQVVMASAETTEAVGELESSSRQVAESIDEIADGATEQAESLQTVTQEMSGLSATIEEIASSSDEVASIASQTANTGADGQQTASEAVERMAETEQHAKQAADAIETLESDVAHIDELIDRISEIAEQTNILALNANIEAARQNNSNGEGFGVVATEIKDLSEEVKETADQVETRINAIQQQTAEVVDVVETTSDRSQVASEQVQSTVTALDQIADYAQKTDDGVQEISNATEDQAATTEEVVNMVDEVAAISEETTAEADTVAASAEEQVTSLESVAKSMENLSDQADRLSTLLDEFETATEK